MASRMHRLAGGMLEASSVAALAATVLALGPTPASGQSNVGVIAFERVVGTNSDIYTIAPSGGRLRRLTAAPGSDFAPSWRSDGRIVFVSDRSGRFELFTMTSKGALERQLTRSGPPNKNSPDWAPDDKRIAFAAGRTRGADIYLRAGGSGFLNVTRKIFGDDASPSWSPDGGQFVFSNARGERQRLYLCDVQSGTIRALTRGSGLDSDPAWSPDGQRIAFTRRDANGNYDVWVIEPGSRIEHRLTSNSAQDRAPSWSPDGTSIAFVTNRDKAADYEIYVMGADGSEPVNITNSPRTLDLAPDWSNASIRAAALSMARAPQVAADQCDSPVGSPSNDDLVGNDTDQTLCGFGGDDRIHGRGGKDRINGGEGNDELWGERGQDLLQGAAGKDKLHGGRGPDTFLCAGGGKDEVDGGPGKRDRVLITCDLDDVLVGIP